MAGVDRVLIAPAGEELGEALRAAAAEANKRCRKNLVVFTAGELKRPLTAFADRPEGNERWAGGWSSTRRDEATSYVTLAWWTDAIGRRHARVTAARLSVESDPIRRERYPRHDKLR